MSTGACVSFGEAHMREAHVKPTIAGGRSPNERVDSLANRGVAKGMGVA